MEFVHVVSDEFEVNDILMKWFQMRCSADEKILCLKIHFISSLYSVLQGANSLGKTETTVDRLDSALIFVILTILKVL